MKNKNNAEVSKSRWDSLEIIKIAVSILTPLVLLWLGGQFNQASIKNAQAREREAQVIKKRIELWDKMGKSINDIYCYTFKVGNIRELTPKDMLNRKIELDTTVYTYRPFFSDEFFRNYQNFIEQAFKDYGGSVQMRTTPFRLKDGDPDKSLFTNEDNTKAFGSAYFELMQGVGKELDVVISKPEATKSQTPDNKVEPDNKVPPR